MGKGPAGKGVLKGWQGLGAGRRGDGGEGRQGGGGVGREVGNGEAGGR